MADAIVGSRPPLRFFCHSCLIEFEDVLQEFTCPFCDGGFIEQVQENETIILAADYSDADMSNIDDMDVTNLDESEQATRPRRTTIRRPLNDLAFLMSGGRLRSPISTTNATSTTNTSTTTTSTPRRPTLVEELIWMIGGARGAGGNAAGAMTAGAPFVLVGAPGDYVFGGDGLDAVVTQLLGQLEHSGPPPLPRDRLAELPTEQVTEEQANANIACSVCWDNFQLGETTTRLECEHVFHQNCITPWLQLHATCPICRRSLLPPDAAAAHVPPPAPASDAAPASATPTTTTASAPSTDTLSDMHIRMRVPRLVIRRTAGRYPVFRRFQSELDALNGTSSSSSPSSSISTGAWAPTTRSTSSTGSNSSTSLNNDPTRQYNMDMDFD